MSYLGVHCESTSGQCDTALTVGVHNPVPVEEHQFDFIIRFEHV